MTAETQAKNANEAHSASALAAGIVRASRSLTNPDIRIALPDDFPPIVPFRKSGAVLNMLTQELARRGKTIDDIGTLTFAYPHKNPDIHPGHRDIAKEAIVDASYFLANAYRYAMQEKHGGEPEDYSALPFKLQIAHALCEDVHLGRSEDQSSMHALTSRQIYTVNEKLQDAPLDFIDPAKQDKPHYVVLVDGSVEQGTTLANLASYIMHNGGDVLFATAGYLWTEFLVPKRDTDELPEAAARLTATFARAAHKAAMADIGCALMYAIRRDKGEQIHTNDINEALGAVEATLNKNGHSLFALTHSEAERLVKSLYRGDLSFAELTQQVPVRSSKKGFFHALA